MASHARSYQSGTTTRSRATIQSYFQAAEELPGPGYFTGPVVKTQNRFDTETLASFNVTSIRNPYPELKSRSGTPGPGEYNAHTPRSLSPKKGVSQRFQGFGSSSPRHTLSGLDNYPKLKVTDPLEPYLETVAQRELSRSIREQTEMLEAQERQMRLTQRRRSAPSVHSSGSGSVGLQLLGVDVNEFGVPMSPTSRLRPDRPLYETRGSTVRRRSLSRSRVDQKMQKTQRGNAAATVDASSALARRQRWAQANAERLKLMAHGSAPLQRGRPGGRARDTDTTVDNIATYEPVDIYGASARAAAVLRHPDTQGVRAHVDPEQLEGGGWLAGKSAVRQDAAFDTTQLIHDIDTIGRYTPPGKQPRVREQPWVRTADRAQLSTRVPHHYDQTMQLEDLARSRQVDTTTQAGTSQPERSAQPAQPDEEVTSDAMADIAQWQASVDAAAHRAEQKSAVVPRTGVHAEAYKRYQRRQQQQEAGATIAWKAKCEEPWQGEEYWSTGFSTQTRFDRQLYRAGDEESPGPGSYELGSAFERASEDYSSPTKQRGWKYSQKPYQSGAPRGSVVRSYDRRLRTNRSTPAERRQAFYSRGGRPVHHTSLETPGPGAYSTTTSPIKPNRRVRGRSGAARRGSAASRLSDPAGSITNQRRVRAGQEAPSKAASNGQSRSHNPSVDTSPRPDAAPRSRQPTAPPPAPMFRGLGSPTTFGVQSVLTSPMQSAYGPSAGTTPATSPSAQRNAQYAEELKRATDVLRPGQGSDEPQQRQTTAPGKGSGRSPTGSTRSQAQRGRLVRVEMHPDSRLMNETFASSARAHFPSKQSPTSRRHEERHTHLGTYKEPVPAATTVRDSGAPGQSQESSAHAGRVPPHAESLSFNPVAARKRPSNHSFKSRGSEELFPTPDSPGPAQYSPTVDGTFEHNADTVDPAGNGWSAASNRDQKLKRSVSLGEYADDSPAEDSHAVALAARKGRSSASSGLMWQHGSSGTKQLGKKSVRISPTARWRKREYHTDAPGPGMYDPLRAMKNLDSMNARHSP